MSEPVFIGCFRVSELRHPAPESTSMVCQWGKCVERIWVHPTSVQISIEMGGLLVCLDHLDTLPDVRLAVHPLQRADWRNYLRGSGAEDVPGAGGGEVSAINVPESRYRG